MQITTPTLRHLACTSLVALLAGCEGGLPDFDLRDLGNGFDTSEAVENLPTRPQPDARGVISYPNYQVAVAQGGDTAITVASRLGLNPTELARFNGIQPDTALRAGEVLALPTRIADATVTAAPATGTLDVAAIATTALDRADASAPPPVPAPVTQPAAAEPVRHKVQRGETAFSVARLYGVPVSAVAEWNGLSSDLAIREGQFLLIPQSGQRPPEQDVSAAPQTDPGQGTPTPVPPSAATALPDATPAPAAEPVAAPEAPDIGTPSAPTPAQSNARLVQPVPGAIIRAYAPGKNEGIDIGAPAGTPVKAADAGTVAAVTTDTAGVAIVVIKHADNLLTVYTNLDGLSVAKGDSVSRGGTIGKVRDGSPSFLHFETRRGLQSIDPTELLP